MGRAALLINNDYEEIRPAPKKKTTKTNQKLATIPSTKAASHFSLRKVTPLTHPQRQMIRCGCPRYCGRICWYWEVLRCDVLGLRRTSRKEHQLG
jgi:hypothetical protein